MVYWYSKWFYTQYFEKFQTLKTSENNFRLNLKVICIPFLDPSFQKIKQLKCRHPWSFISVEKPKSFEILFSLSWKAKKKQSHFSTEFLLTIKIFWEPAAFIFLKMHYSLWQLQKWLLLLELYMYTKSHSTNHNV